MDKRGIIFGDYNTAVNGWTLTAWKLSVAEQKTKYIDKPGGDGTWDLTTVLTDGIVRYKDRVLTATFECSEDSRLTRENEIRRMVNALDGMRVDIVLPDDTEHYMVGRLKVVREYNDLAHACVTVTATCEPWKYANAETIVTVAATEEAQPVTLQNEGRRAVVPEISVTGGTVHLEYGSKTTTLSEGTWQWANLLLTPGDHALTYRGEGSIDITYREAVLE